MEMELNSNFNVSKLLQEIAALRHENKSLRENMQGSNISPRSEISPLNKQEISSLLEENKKLREDLQEIGFLRHENKNLREDLEHFKELVRLLKHQKFAAKSEAYPYGLRTLFDEAESEVQKESASLFDETSDFSEEKKNKKRGNPKRKPLPESLPRIRNIIDIPEKDKFCALTGTPLVQIGEEVSESLSIEPAKLTVIETVRPKYVCNCPACAKKDEQPCTDADEQSKKVKIAELPATAIPKSMATPSLLSFIAVSKYFDALPLHRQERILERSGIVISRSTLASWMIKCGELIRPLINLAKDVLLDSRLIQADETRYQILKRSGKKATSQSYVWVFMNIDPGGGPKVIIYEVGPSRSHTVPLQFLDGYEGYLQTDGYEAYETLISRAPGITLVGDWVHVRRRYDEAVKAHGKLPGFPKAKEGLLLINELFKIERENAEITLEERLTVRQEKSLEITTKLFNWANEVQPTIPPKSLTGKAISYMLERWSKLILFLDDPILRLDTNPVENAIRPFTIGRNNWLFSDSMAGAESSASLYSLICMARAADLNPYEYLKDVFSELPRAKTADEVEKLLPWNWKATAAV